MNNTTKSKKGKRSPALVAGLILLFLLIVIIITLAMFASFDEVTNVFEAGKVDIVLVEDKWDPNDGDKTVPNTIIDKNPAITNKEDTVNTYVFLKVYVPYENDPCFIIEKAEQDESGQGGKVLFDQGKAPEGSKSAPVPIYKFVATGKKYKSDGEAGQPAKKGVTYDGTLYGNGCDAQMVNPGWKLLKDYPKKVDSLKAYEYVYAHVHKVDGKDELLPLLAGTTTEYPLFNQIYVQNFRERDLYEKDEYGNYILVCDKDGNNNDIPNTEHKVPTGASTLFPDPNRNYSIRVEAYGIQSYYLKENNTTTYDPEEVWKDYINKTGGG